MTKENEEKDEAAESETEEEETQEDTKGEEEQSEESEEEEQEIVERDFDAEIEEEENQGKPDPNKAHKRIKDKEAEGEEDEADDDDQPVTRGELKKLRQETEKAALESVAITLAATLTDNEKEARLVVAKWKNRSYPAGMPLDKQIREAYVVTNADKILGESAETKRALKNRSRSNNNGAGSHRDAPINYSEPKLSDAEKLNLKKSGFEYNAKNKRYEKALKKGVLVRDPRTKKSEFISK